MAAAPRRRRAIGQRRRVEDEGEEEGGHGQAEIDDDSLSEGTLASDDNDLADDSDTSNVDEASPIPHGSKNKGGHNTNGKPKSRVKSADGRGSKPSQNKPSDTDIMLNGLSMSDDARPVQELNFDEVAPSETKPSAPLVVSSSSATHPAASQAAHDRRRREHDEYRRKRDEDPAFVPNRGAFFMHDFRHAGPSANGFRPYGRGRGRGRGGIGGPFAPMHTLYTPADPTTNSQWTHDMHETVANPGPSRIMRQQSNDDGPPNGDGIIPTCPSNSEPINRTLSTEKHIGNVQIRVFLPSLKEPIIFSGHPVKQYTKLPDHRPPLRRDKPVRISLPDFPPRYIFPATDRSFIFIPRAMRPNQQRVRGKPRSGFGSVGGFSRRTSVFGGSYYNGSTYSPSIALSRRSSIAPDMGRDYIISPTGSAVSRPPFPLDSARPVVKLPPLNRQEAPPQPGQDYAFSAPIIGEPLSGAQSTISDLPQPQTHPLPQKPVFQENRPVQLPIHQPRPQKAVSVADIESPDAKQPYGQAFHQQVPLQVANGFESHNRQPSYPSHHSTGTPLSQIPERAIHAAPFQPNPYSQPGYYPQPYQMMQPQQNYYYPGAPYSAAMGPAAAPAFIPGGQPGQPQGDSPAPQANGQLPSGPNLVAQEVNGMVYYYDASQLPNMSSYPSFSAPQNFPVSNVTNMNGMVTSSPDGFYYPQANQGMVYYPQ